MSAVRMKIKDILVAANLLLEAWQVGDVLTRLAERMGMYEYLRVPDLESLAPYRVEFKGDRSYDSRRGAELYVIYHEQKVICICSFAGRELDDTSSVHVYDHLLLRDLLLRFTNQAQQAQDEQFDVDGEVDVVYWEGCPIRLGESVYGYDD